MEQITAYVDERVAIDHEHGFTDSNAQYRSMAAEVAIACGVSVTTAKCLMADSWQLSTKAPATMAKLREGDLQFYAARVIANATCVIDDDSKRALADRVIAEEAVDLIPGRVSAMAERRVFEVDPDAADRRARRERDEQRVTVSDGWSGTASLSVCMESERVAACHDALRREARARKAAGADQRLGQLMCQVLFERLTGAASVTDVKAQVNLVMTDTTLFALSDAPANLIGCGPLPAHAARLLATSRNASLRRLYTDPVDGSVVAADTQRRCFDGSLADLITVRDQQCRGIRCASPITAKDHVVEHANGGRTSFDNGQGLSTNCHTTREHPEMTVTKAADSAMITWRTPSGLTFRSLPPAALGAGSLTPEQITLRRLQLHPPKSEPERVLLSVVIQHIRLRQSSPHTEIEYAERPHHSSRRPGAAARPVVHVPAMGSQDRIPAPASAPPDDPPF